MPPKVKITVGQKFNNWTVIKELKEKDINGCYLYECICICGKTLSVKSTSLNKGRSNGCGCCKYNNRTHYKSKSKEYRIWSSMRERCNNPKNKYYYNYGGRGITVCERWGKFENFFEDMGIKQGKLSLDRIDNNKGYSKENCRWATKFEQDNNKRNTIFINTVFGRISIREASVLSSIKHSTISFRIKLGWPEKDLLLPIMSCYHKKEY